MRRGVRELPLALRVVKTGTHTFVPPKLSARKAAIVRNRAIENNKYFVGADLEKSEFDPNWSKRNRSVVMRAPKGHKRERDREKRVAKIEDAMSTMDQQIDDYYAAEQAERYDSYLDQFLSTKAGLKDDWRRVPRNADGTGKKKKGHKNKKK